MKPSARVQPTRLVGIGISVFAGSLAALVLFIVFSGGTDAPSDEAAVIVTPVTPTPANATPTSTPAPTTWLEALGEPANAPSAVLVSCGDANGDSVIDSRDGPSIPGGISITLDLDQSCIAPDLHGDFYAGVPFSDAAAACDGVTPVQIVLAASAGSDLMHPREGESLGMITIANDLRSQLEERGAEASVMVAVSAIFGAEMPQTSMEGWVAAHVRETLDAMPCAQAIIIGHSHGGVTATAAAIALEDAYADRVLVVLIDRTAVLYDRIADEMPQAARVLNFFQLNEGWHGEPIDQPNVENFDESDERAPIAASDGGGDLAIVSHKTLDDAVAVQRAVVELGVAWAIE
jgi:hypothetical protein